MRALPFQPPPERLRLPVDIAPRIIGILGFDGVATLDFIGPLEAFKAARDYDNYHRRRSCYEVVILGLTNKTFVSESGVVCQAERLLAGISALDTLLIPGGSGSRLLEVKRQISAWLRQHHEKLRRVATVCTGLYPLAESGLIDGREVVTHWRCAREFAQCFPALRVNETASFLQDGRFYTAGGGRAGMEMTLALINEDYGPQVAREVAREFVLRLKPSGAEQSLIFAPKDQAESSERLLDLPAWILAHLDGDLSVEALADKCAVCPRHFSRLFKRVFSKTPAEFVEQLRLGEARRRLLLPDTTIKSVAEAVGFKSADAFRRAFERELKISPTTFRVRFADAAAASSGLRRSPGPTPLNQTPTAKRAARSIGARRRTHGLRA